MRIQIKQSAVSVDISNKLKISRFNASFENKKLTIDLLRKKKFSFVSSVVVKMVKNSKNKKKSFRLFGYMSNT
jgi:hypothetical protein